VSSYIHFTMIRGDTLVLRSSALALVPAAATQVSSLLAVHALWWAGVFLLLWVKHLGVSRLIQALHTTIALRVKTCGLLGSSGTRC
jgi:hypothetical protein